MVVISWQQLLNDLRESLQLKLLSGDLPSPHPPPPEMASAADIVGHLNSIHSNRIQVLGHQENDYLSAMDDKEQEKIALEVKKSSPLALVFSESIVVPAAFNTFIKQANIPVFSSPLPAAQLIDNLRIYLTKLLAPRVLLHGVFMDVLGLGVLITGKSGLGKSELGLDLITRGHGLVADDVTEFTRIAPNTIEGRCPVLLKDYLEVRGVGLINIKTIFGETALRRKMRLRLVVQLQAKVDHDWSGDRLGLTKLTESILDVAIRKVVIPVDAGRNLAVLLEAAVRNTILQLRGVDTMAEFSERQARAMLPKDLL